MLDVTHHILHVKTAVMHLSNEEFSELVNDSDDCSGEPAKVIFISITELLTVFTVGEWLFGMWITIKSSKCVLERYARRHTPCITIKICNGIMFDFYPGLPHMCEVPRLSVTVGMQHKPF